MPRYGLPPSSAKCGLGQERLNPACSMLTKVANEASSKNCTQFGTEAVDDTFGQGGTAVRWTHAIHRIYHVLDIRMFHLGIHRNDPMTRVSCRVPHWLLPGLGNDRLYLLPPGRRALATVLTDLLTTALDDRGRDGSRSPASRVGVTRGRLWTSCILLIMRRSSVLFRDAITPAWSKESK